VIAKNPQVAGLAFRLLRRFRKLFFLDLSGLIKVI
jgi:hypothetical protein